MEMCRACLSTGTAMIPMNESTLENFNQITNLKIKLSDHMPLYTCHGCHNALAFCKEFRDKCIASDHALNEILVHNDKRELTLKSEDNDYYVVIEKESKEDNKKDKITEEFYETEINNYDTIMEPSVEIITEDLNEEVIQNLDTNSDVFCGLCSAFTDKEKLIEHLATHNDDNNCQICLEPSNSKSELLAHRTQHVPYEQRGCLFCEKGFVNTASLQFHYMTVHKLNQKSFENLEQEYLNKPVQCIDTSPAKEKKVKKTSRIVKQKLLVVDKEKIVLSETELKKLLEKPKEGFVPYYCGVCPQEMEDKRQLMRHLQYHRMDTHCSLCELEFTNYPHLLAHRLAHIPDNQNSCLFCSLKIIDESVLEQHYLDKHNLTEEVLPYCCKKCFRTYETEKQMKQHMKDSHGAIKYICDYCCKGFRLKGALIAHMVTHQDCRHYKCAECDYRAKIPGILKDHKLRRHTKSRVYCRVCRRAFATQDMLDRHMPCVVDSDVTCPICGINLRMSSSVSR